MDLISWVFELLKLLKEKKESDSSREKEWLNLIETLKQLMDLLSEIEKAITSYPHTMENKECWANRLTDFAKENLSGNNKLKHCSELIARKLQDYSFDHEKHDSSIYCCDELLLDLYQFTMGALFELSRIKKIEIEDSLKIVFSKMWERRPGMRLIIDKEKEKNDMEKFFYPLEKSDIWAPRPESHE
jgi:hypothetical protein